MDGLLSLIVICVSFALFVCLVSRSVRPAIVTAFAIMGYFALRAIGVLG